MPDDGSRYPACRRPESRSETIDDSRCSRPQSDPYEELATRSRIWTGRVQLLVERMSGRLLKILRRDPELALHAASLSQRHFSSSTWTRLDAAQVNMLVKARFSASC